MATDWIGKNQPAWVHGIKRKTAELHSEFFHKHILAIVRARSAEIPHAASSTDAEEKLGIPASLYWYLGRADDLYGEVVFLCQANALASDAHLEGMCPFDSGGMWSGRIHTNPTTAPMSKERREIFWQSNMPLLDWDKTFTAHLQLRYSTQSQYVRGHPPTGMSADFAVVCSQPPNHPVAWTWEARIACERADNRVRARHGYMTKARKDAVLNWAETQPWDILTEALPWLQSETETALPGTSPVTSPVELASRLLESV